MNGIKILIIKDQMNKKEMNKEEVDYGVIKNAIKFARDQAGARLLQSWIEIKDLEINNLIFENVDKKNMN